MINEYLVDAFKRLDKSQKEIIKDLDKSQPYVSALMNGKKTIGKDVAKKLNELYGFDISKMLVNTEDLQQSEEHKQSYKLAKKTKYYDLDASAGPIEMFDPGNGFEYKDVVIPGFSDCNIALNVWGDSMEPLLKSGEIVLCREWIEKFIEYGSVYLIVTKNNHRMIKYLKRSDTEGKITCVSENDFYEPFEIELKDIHKLFTIKGHIARNAI